MRRSTYISLTVIAAVFGMTSAWLPEPFNGLGIFLFIIGFLMLIGTGHRAASRASSAGIFAFWWKPAKMATAEIDEPDHWPANLALVATICPVLSMLSRIVWLA